jgi:hypothetical protein
MWGESQVPSVFSFLFSPKSATWRKMLKATRIPDIAVPKSNPLIAMAAITASMTVMIVVSILSTRFFYCAFP